MLVGNDCVVVMVDSLHGDPFLTVITASLILVWLDSDWGASLRLTLEHLLRPHLPLARTSPQPWAGLLSAVILKAWFLPHGVSLTWELVRKYRFSSSTQEAQ